MSLMETGESRHTSEVNETSEVRGQPEVLQGGGGVRLRDMKEVHLPQVDLSSLDHKA